MGLLLTYTGHLTGVNCPAGNFCLKEGLRWMLVFYIAGMFYMFAALAVVCEEFFVPSLELFVDEYSISLDVAGATLMAAGGSMPELFTSFIGTLKESDIGMAAIVGSAVFNVLFVIATCAVASHEVLVLTWWPLARDCSFYLATLVTLAVFFKGSTPGRIDAWEAAILLVEYVTYCTFMKFNQRIYGLVAARFARSPQVGLAFWSATPQVTPEDTSTKVEPVSRGIDAPGANASFLQPSTFRASIVALLVQNESMADTAGMTAVSKVTGDLRQAFDRFDKDGSGHIDDAEFSSLLEELGMKSDSKSLESAIRSVARLSTDGQVSFDAFQKWYLNSEVRIEIKMGRVFESFDSDGNGTIEHNEVAALLRGLGHQPSEEEVATAIQAMVIGSDEVRLRDISDTESKDGKDVKDRLQDATTLHVTYDQFCQWYKNSFFWTERQKHFEREEAVTEAHFSLDAPRGRSCSAWVWYVLTYPICAAMYITMPDVRRKECGTVLMAVVEFLLSLVWIAVFSLSLVEWTEICCNTIGIPVPVAGLTIVAAGTSIPDLLSSYIVAKQGQGDMAVSSSIGSNIFDVTVGLPLPWLIFNIYKGPVAVRTDSLGVSIIVLILMIASVILTVKLMRWRMTKCMGYVMFVLYALFLAQALVQQMPEDNPVLPAPF